MDTDKIVESVVSGLIVAGVVGLVSLIKAYFDTHRSKDRREAQRRAIEVGVQRGIIQQNNDEGEAVSYQYKTPTKKLLLRILFSFLSVIAVAGALLGIYGDSEPPESVFVALGFFSVVMYIILLWNLVRVIYRIAWGLLGGMYRLLV